MRCKRCGIQIPNGTLCDECYEIIKQDKEIEKDNQLLYKITRKFLPQHQLLLNWEIIAFGVLMFLFAIIGKNITAIFASLIFVVVALSIFLMISKRIAVGTKCYFYETKVVYKFDFLFIHKKKVLKYSEIKDITYNQKRTQKKFGLGTINVFSNKSGFIFNGFIIEDVPNIEETVKKLVELVGPKIY